MNKKLLPLFFKTVPFSMSRVGFRPSWVYTTTRCLECLLNSLNKVFISIVESQFVIENPRSSLALSVETVFFLVDWWSDCNLSGIFDYS